MRSELYALLVLTFFAFSLIGTVSGQAEISIWKDDLNYSSFGQMQAAGWTSENPTGVSFGGAGVILDDTAIHYSNRLPTGINDWKIECKGKWTAGAHGTINIAPITDRHAYLFAADGWYNEFYLYRDEKKILNFGHYVDVNGEWVTLRIEKKGNQISMYFNDNLENTYIETDTTPSNLVGVDSGSPWRGAAEYDYFQAWSTGSNVLTPQTSLWSNPIVIGGIVVGIVIGVGGAVYFFVLGGTGAAGSVGGAAGGAGAVPGTGGVAGSGSGAGTASGGAGGGSNLHPINPELIAQIDAVQSQAQNMHNSAANLMSNPYTAAAGNAINAQATLMDAQALQLQAQNMHNSAANLMSNPYTAAAGNALDSQASAMEAQATQLQAQAQPNRPPTSNTQTTGNSTPDADSTQGGNTDAQNDSAADNSGGNTPSDAGEP